VLGIASSGTGCSTNPATGRSSFTGFMSSDEEKKVGRDEHPKILREFGGEYADPKIRQYVQQLGERLAKNSEMADLKFTFTVLNSDIINAFALPGGYVYVTRGLMALASSEAELAGVIGHEIGHVTARHTAERYSRSVVAETGLNILAIGVGILTGSSAAAQAAGQVGGLGAGAYLAGYSREQEFEADTLGVRYLDRTGFDDAAMASFLTKMQEETRLSAEIAGRGDADEFSIMQSHPRTADRVRAATEEARKQGATNTVAHVGRDEYLDRLEGMSWGGDRENGWVLNRQFIHPGLRFRFEVPQGFRLMNGERNVSARGPSSARIVFDQAPRTREGRNSAEGLSPADYLQRVWGRNSSLSQVESITINGLQAATAATRLSTNSGSLDARLVTIRFDEQTMFRFLFASPPAQTVALNEPYRRTTYSFVRLTDREVQNARPPRIRVVRVASGDTAESLARRMPFEEFGAQRFRVLNGIAAGQPPRVGERVKIVTAD
jgi:predicted Zn-dependent protease